MRIDSNDVCVTRREGRIFVVDPFESLPSSPPSDARRTLFGGGGTRGHCPDHDGSWSETNKRQTAGGGSGGVVNDLVTETGRAAAAAAAGNRGGRQQSTAIGSTSILHEIITV
jgi:hypothetical protein